MMIQTTEWFAGLNFEVTGLLEPIPLTVRMFESLPEYSLTTPTGKTP